MESESSSKPKKRGSKNPDTPNFDSALKYLSNSSQSSLSLSESESSKSFRVNANYEETKQRMPLYSGKNILSIGSINENTSSKESNSDSFYDNFDEAHSKRSQ